MTSYTTIAGRATAEIEEKKSRFIASLAHVETEDEALAFLEEIRAANRMARHNVYAYVLREGGAGVQGRVRYSDDGEPQKTAYEIYSGDWSSDVCSSDLQKTRRSGFLNSDGAGERT